MEQEHKTKQRRTMTLPALKGRMDSARGRRTLSTYARTRR